MLVVQVGENGCHLYRYDVMSGFVLSHDKRFPTRTHSRWTSTDRRGGLAKGFLITCQECSNKLARSAVIA